MGGYEATVWSTNCNPNVLLNNISVLKWQKNMQTEHNGREMFKENFIGSHDLSWYKDLPENMFVVNTVQNKNFRVFPLWLIFHKSLSIHGAVLWTFIAKQKRCLKNSYSIWWKKKWDWLSGSFPQASNRYLCNMLVVGHKTRSPIGGAGV